MVLFQAASFVGNDIVDLFFFFLGQKRCRTGRFGMRRERCFFLSFVFSFSCSVRLGEL